MLTITIPEKEYFDDSTNTFFKVKKQTLTLEHSLVSISKWEAKWNKPFLSEQQKSMEEFIDYVKYMTLTQNVDPMVYNGLTAAHIKAIQDYIEAPMTATTFGPDRRKTGRGASFKKEIVTSELVYYWMIRYEIPVEFQKWHFNRLLTLIRVCDIKGNPDAYKMNKRSIYEQNAQLNAMRKAKMHSHG